MSDDDFFLDGDGGVATEEARPTTAAKASGDKKPQQSPPPPSEEKLDRSEEMRSRHPKAARIVYFDLETIPDESRLHLFQLPPVPPIPKAIDESQCPDPVKLALATVADVQKALKKAVVVPPAYLDKLAAAEAADKNRDGVLKAIEDARKVRDVASQAHADRLKLLSVTPEYCRIASAVMVRGKDEVSAVGNGDMSTEELDEMERQVLRRFWELWAVSDSLCGFNIVHFDIPVIYVRSAILGVKPTRPIDCRSWGKDVIDLYALRFPRGSAPEGTGKMKSMARLYGVDVPAGDADGGSVLELFHGDTEKLLAYNRSDVSIVMNLHAKLAGTFWE